MVVWSIILAIIPLTFAAFLAVMVIDQFILNGSNITMVEDMLNNKQMRVSLKNNSKPSYRKYTTKEISSRI